MPDEVKSSESAAERPDAKTPPWTTPGRTLVRALWIALTKGDGRELLALSARRGSSSETAIPITTATPMSRYVSNATQFALTEDKASNVHIPDRTGNIAAGFFVSPAAMATISKPMYKTRRR